MSPVGQLVPNVLCRVPTSDAQVVSCQLIIHTPLGGATVGLSFPFDSSAVKIEDRESASFKKLERMFAILEQSLLCTKYKYLTDNNWHLLQEQPFLKK